jgi:hypothetical protein
MKSLRLLPFFLTFILLSISCQSGPRTKEEKPEKETAGERSEIDQVTREPAVEEQRELTFDDKDPLPVDPAVITGRLENGLAYYIRENSKPRTGSQRLDKFR